MRGLVFLSAVLLSASSCAKPSEDISPDPGQAQIGSYSGDIDAQIFGGTEPSSDIVLVPADSVWIALPIVYERLDLEAEFVDRRGQRIGNTRFSPRRIEDKRMSQYIECGYGMTTSNNADTYRVTMYLVTRIQARDGGGTLVQTTVDATAKPREVSGNAVACRSKGTLEKRIVELVGEALADLNRPKRSKAGTSL